MIKVLYIISTLKKTGPVNVIYNIIKNLDRTKYEPVILTLSKEPSGSIKSDFEKLGIKCHCLNVSGLKGYFEAGKIKKVVKEITPDIIHTHCFRSTLFTAIYLRKMNTITTIHCDYDVDFRMTYGNFIGFLIARLMDFSLINMNRRIACSEYLSQIINNKKIFKVDYINNGIDIEIFHSIENKETLKEKLKLPRNKKIFIWVGCLTERKNPLLLANVIKEFYLTLTDCYFVFCGDGPLKQELENTISNFDNVLLTGNIDNIQEYLQASDYYISTSLSEGLPLSVLEGMACGLPVILSNIEQHKILFKDNMGKCFNLQDDNELLNNLINIQKENYENLSIKSRNVVEKLFSAVNMSINYQKNYKDIYELKN